MSAAAGPDGNLWFTEHDDGKIGKVNILSPIPFTPTPTPTVKPTLTRTASVPPTPTNTGIVSPCPGDLNGDGKVTVDELVRAVNSALDGCTE